MNTPSDLVETRNTEVSFSLWPWKGSLVDGLMTTVRGIRVYAVAGSVYLRNRRTAREVQLRVRELGLSTEEEIEEHPEVLALWARNHQFNAKVVYEAMIEFKGLWIKLGQYLSSRSDVMPLAYIEQLESLQDSLPPVPWHKVHQVLVSQFGKDYFKNLFLSIDKKPLSTSSISQVHKARLKSGQEVVIKVRHENIENLIMKDLENLKILCDWIDWLDPQYELSKVVQEWALAVKGEFDFRIEAANLREITKSMNLNNINVIIPSIPDPTLVTKEVLVMEHCAGFSIRDRETILKSNIDRSLLLDRICTAWAIQVYVDGFFNADPDPGNILVSTDSTRNKADSAVPVLLDFGFTRRFPEKMKIAFARMVHSIHVRDVGGLLRSLSEMGLQFGDSRNPFKNTSIIRKIFIPVPASEAEADRRKFAREHKKEFYDNDKGAKKRTIYTWPGELVFLRRVVGLLSELCSSLDIVYPYLETTAMVAAQTLLHSIPKELHAKQCIYPDSLAPSSSPLNQRLHSFINSLDPKYLLGMQVAVMQGNMWVCDISAGKLGPVDPYPVQPDTLFNIFSVTKGITAALMHAAIRKTNSSFDDLISQHWPEFAQNGKDGCTIAYALNHRAGLAKAAPDNLDIYDFLDWERMVDFLAGAEPSHPPGHKAIYHPLNYGWLIGGIIEKMTGLKFTDCLREWITKPLNLENELFIGIPPSLPDTRLAILQNPIDTNMPPDAGYGEKDYLFNFTTFNARIVRESVSPAANGHATARAMAKFYANLEGIIGEQNLRKCLMEVMETDGRGDSAYEANAKVPYGLGFKIYKFQNGEGKMVYGLGHPGIGGSLALTIPELSISLSINVSNLENERKTTNSIVQGICKEFNITPVNAFI